MRALNEAYKDIAYGDPLADIKIKALQYCRQHYEDAYTPEDYQSIIDAINQAQDIQSVVDVVREYSSNPDRYDEYDVDDDGEYLDLDYDAVMRGFIG